MLGVSYLAISQYAAAAGQPPALRAICPWEGFTDAYRDLMFPGGVCEQGFSRLWSRNLWPDTRQTYSLAQMQEDHPLRDDFWQSLAPDLSAINVPMLVCGSFSDNNLHSRGSMRAFTQSAPSTPALHPSRRQMGDVLFRCRRAEQLKFFRAVLEGAPQSRSVRWRCARTVTLSPPCERKPNGRSPAPVGGPYIWVLPDD